MLRLFFSGGLSDNILTAVLSLLKKEVPEHGRHVQQYFHFFLMYAGLGLKEVGSHGNEDRN